MTWTQLGLQLHLLCLTSLLSLAASENHGLSQELLDSYLRTKFVNVLKDEIAEKIKPEEDITINYDIAHDKSESSERKMECIIYDLKLQHKSTIYHKSINIRKRNWKWYTMTYGVLAKIECTYREFYEGTELNSDTGYLQFRGRKLQLLLTVYTKEEVDECFVILGDTALENQRNENESFLVKVNGEEWDRYKLLHELTGGQEEKQWLGVLEEKVRERLKLIVSSITVNTNWLCGKVR